MTDDVGLVEEWIVVRGLLVSCAQAADGAEAAQAAVIDAVMAVQRMTVVMVLVPFPRAELFPVPPLSWS